MKLLDQVDKLSSQVVWAEVVTVVTVGFTDWQAGIAIIQTDVRINKGNIIFNTFFIIITTKLNANYYNEKLSIKLGPLVKVRFRSARYYRHDDRMVTAIRVESLVCGIIGLWNHWSLEVAVPKL